MMIRLTQKLGKKIGVSPKEALPLERNPYADWTGHLFTAKRVQYILLVNTSSLFAVVLFGRGISNDGQLLKMALTGIREAVVDAVGESVYQRLIAPATEQIRFSKTNDRRVLGSINELVFQAKCHLEDDELSPSQVAERLNNTLMSLIKYQTPGEAFRSMKLQTPGGQAGKDPRANPKPPDDTH